MATFIQWFRAPKVVFPLYVCGADSALRDYVVREAIEAVLVQCNQCSRPHLNVVTRLENEALLNDVLSQESSCCMKVVIVNGMDISDKTIVRIMAWVDNPPPNLRLIYETNEVNVKGSQEPLATFRRKGSFVECKPLKAEQIGVMIKAKLPRIEQIAVDYLIRTVQSTSALLNELRKLEVLPERVPLSKRFVEEFCSPTVELFADALMSGDKLTAMKAVYRINRTDYNRVLGLLEWTVVRVIILCSYKGVRASYSELAKVAKVPDWRLKKFLEWARAGVVRWLHRLELVASTDSLVRRGMSIGVMERLVWLW